MPRYVALDWDDQQIRAVFATLQGESITIEDALTLAIDTDKGPDNLAALAETIRQSVADHRYRAAEALITIRRADVELRLLSLPTVPEEELPEIVRFQALQDFSEISEDWPIDYLRVSDAPGEMTVLAATVPKDRVARFSAITEKAELKAKSIILRPCAAGSLVNHQTSIKQERIQLMVDEFGTGLELTVLKDKVATFIRTVQRPTGPSRVNLLAGEIRRTIVAAQNQMGGDRVEQVIVFGAGPDHEAAREQLEERLEITVTSIDPFEDPTINRKSPSLTIEDPSLFTAALGLLVNQNDPGAAVLDFLNPRKVEEPKSKRPMAIASIAGVGSVLLLLTAACWWYLSSLDQQILELQRTSQGLRKNVETAEARISEYKSVQQWMRGDVNWLDEMRDISTELPPPDQAKVREFRANISPSGNGLIVLEGIVDNQQTISAVERNLRDERHRVRGEGGLFEEQDDKYPWRFKETITVETSPTKSKKNPTTNQRPTTTPQQTNNNRAQQP